MNSNLNVYVKLTKQDMKDFRSKSVFSSSWVTFIAVATAYLLLKCFLSIFNIIIYVLLTHQGTLLACLPHLFLFIIVEGLILLPFMISYWEPIKTFEKTSIMHRLVWYSIREDGITLSSSHTFYPLKWEDSIYIKDLGLCFYITTKKGNRCIIPKRCFYNAEHLNKFLDIISAHLPQNKCIKIKRTMPKNFSPDYIEQDASKVPFIPLQETCDLSKDPLFKLDFSFTKQELLSLTFGYHFKSIPAILMILYGLIFIALGILCRDEVFICFLCLLIGISLIILPAAFLYFSIHKQFKKDSSSPSIITHLFYDDFHRTDFDGGIAIAYWNELVKVTENKKFYFLFVAHRLRHVLPKRILEQNTEHAALFQKLTKRTL